MASQSFRRPFRAVYFSPSGRTCSTVLCKWKGWKLECALRKSRYNRPFYSCGSVTRPMNGSEAAGDLVLIQTSLLFFMQMQAS